MTARPDGHYLTIKGVPPSDAVIRRIRDESDTVLLAFSCGKDAIAAWLALRDFRPAFRRIVPFYMYAEPGREPGKTLAFIERSLDYYEGYFGTKILRVLHPALYRRLNGFIYQPPERCEVIEAARLPGYDAADLRQWICDDLKLPADTWYASGVRAADSPDRRTAMMTHGPWTQSRRCFYPVWDLRKDGLIAMLVAVGVKLPVDYQWFGRSYDGIDHRFLEPLSRHAPDDYARILEWYPLARLELMRARMHRESQEAAVA
jgi:hypothetical protein